MLVNVSSLIPHASSVRESACQSSLHSIYLSKKSTFNSGRTKIRNESSESPYITAAMCIFWQSSIERCDKNQMLCIKRDVMAAAEKVKTKVSSVVDVTIAGTPRCPVWHRLVTVPTEPFTTFTSPTGPFLSEWAKCLPGNTQNGRTELPIANLMPDSKSGSPSSYSSFPVTIYLSLLVSEIFASDRQTDNADHYYRWPPYCGGPAIMYLVPRSR